jgi:hypothetical protein
VSNTIFQSLVGGGGAVGQIGSQRVVEIATLQEFDENYAFFTTFCDPYTGHTFRLFFTHFTLKRTQRMAFKKKCLK